MVVDANSNVAEVLHVLEVELTADCKSWKKKKKKKSSSPFEDHL